MTQAVFIDAFPSKTKAFSMSCERFAVLDSWRGICALLVALFHFPTSSIISQNVFVGSSYLFVDFFFVLSGFVIAANYGGRLDNRAAVGRFALVRFGRIYPLHLFMLSMFIAFELVRLMLPQLRGAGGAPFSGGTDLSSLLSNLLLLHGMGIEGALTWNGPSWSISAEFFTYLLFATVMILAGTRAWIWLLAAAVTAPLFLLAVSTRHMDVSYDFGFIRCLYGFSLGALLAWFQIDPMSKARQALARSGNNQLWTLIEVATVLTIILFVTLAGDNDASIAAPLVFSAALYVFAHEAGGISRLLRRPAMLTLGAMSYSIYMVHIFIQGRMINVAGLVERKLGLDIVGDLTLRGDMTVGFGPHAHWIGLIAIVVMIVATLISSWLTWRFVEMPALRWFRQIAKHI